MTKFKKATALLLSVVMLVCCFTVQASASSVFSSAQKIDKLEYYSTSFKSKDYAYYKIVLPTSGTIQFRDEEGKAEAFLYNSNAEEIAHTKTDAWHSAFRPDSTWEISKLSKGTYYLKLCKEYSEEIKNFYYTFIPDETPTISIALNVKVGDELDFSALASNYSGKVTWKTTDSKVATVSKGVVNCKKAGKAKIRAYMDNGDYAEITLIVKK